ncbi:MAG: extracellular solute-binding protein [Phycisphaerales bacterium JB040]
MRHKPLTGLLGAIALVTLGACGQGERGSDTPTLVLYSSVDDYVLAEAIEAYERETGIEVRLVGDTEATKTTGLVTRLLAEHESGSSTADVWWSSEPFGSVTLSEAGVLTPYESPAAESAFEDGWPEALIASDGSWYGHALRARVIVHSTERASEPPASLDDLTDPAWNGRIGIARPQFGTTRGHMGALYHAWGPERFEAWLEGLTANGVRVYDSNSTVVRAVWMGEIDVALTDTDDVLVGQNRGWDVAMLEPALDDAGGGPLAVPCTVGLVAGGANPEQGRAFIDWLLSGHGERVLAASESANRPVHPDAGEGYPVALPAHQRGWYESVAESVPAALELCERVLPGG